VFHYSIYKGILIRHTAKRTQFLFSEEIYSISCYYLYHFLVEPSDGLLAGRAIEKNGGELGETLRRESCVASKGWGGVRDLARKAWGPIGKFAPPPEILDRTPPNCEGRRRCHDLIGV
jgi:hypothetical protein